MPDYKDIRMLSIEAGNGRFINNIDMSEERKVVVINQRVADNLFREKSRWENTSKSEA